MALSLKKIWKGLKKIAGTVAMIAAPFIAAPIAGMIGMSGALGSALTGAVVGGLGAAAAGVNPLIGATLGGLGGFSAGGGSLFGAKTAGLAGTSGAAGTGAAATGAPVVAAPAVGLTAAAPAAGGFFSGLNLGNIAPIAMAMFGKQPQDLTEIEKQAIQANMESQATERGVFNQQLDASRALLQAGQANPERAYADAQMATQRGLRDVQRSGGVQERAGLQDAASRRAAIEGVRIGTGAVAGEQARAAQATAAGLQSLPGSVPTSAADLNKTIYADLQQRKYDYAKDLSGAFGSAYGNIA
jgi:hypothetical protein